MGGRLGLSVIHYVTRSYKLMLARLGRLFGGLDAPETITRGLDDMSSAMLLSPIGR